MCEHVCHQLLISVPVLGKYKHKNHSSNSRKRLSYLETDILKTFYFKYPPQPPTTKTKQNNKFVGNLYILNDELILLIF